jgi:leader peptidase (prepilin peptidase) / N-methyltransferase
MNVLLGIVFGVVGLLVGAIINALADDLPLEDSPVRLPHYPDGTPRLPITWVGTLAFLMRMRTSPGGAKLSWRHPITEIVTAALFIYIAVSYPFSARSLVYMGNLAILILITVIDLEHRLILFVVMIPAYVFAVIGAAIVQEVAFRDYLIGGAAGFVLFFLMYMGGKLFNSVVSNARGEELDEVAFGYGDVLLATLSGLMLGWQALIFAVTIAVFAGAGGAILFIVVRLVMRGRYEMLTALPYGQYIVLGTVIMMLWREPIRTMLQGGMR